MSVKESGEATAYEILDPFSLDDFESDYREQQPLHIARANENRFSRLASTEELAELFATSRFFFPNVQLTQAGVEIPSTDYSSASGMIDPARLFARFREGATVVVSGADTLLPEVARLCREMKQQFGCPVRGNLYLSPPGHQGFQPHFDTHDVMILQVAGEKVFNIYENGSELPLHEDTFNPEGFSSGEKTHAYTISAGDTLYIPRGITHDACASDTDMPSLHLTLGLYPNFLKDLLHALIDELTEDDADYRKAIPIPAWKSPGITRELEELVRHKLSSERLLDVLPQVMASLRDEVALDSLSSAAMVNRAPLEPSHDADATVTLCRAGYLGHEILDGVLYCRTFGQVLEFSEPFAGLVDAWLAAGQLPYQQFTSASKTAEEGLSVIKALHSAGLCEVTS